MTYNPQKHHRRSIRLKGYDYSQAGLYFITICCQDRACLFGEITNGKMALNDVGIIAANYWLEIPGHFPHAELHEYIIMPNHVHGIIEIIKKQNGVPDVGPRHDVGHAMAWPYRTTMILPLGHPMGCPNQMECPNRPISTNLGNRFRVRYRLSSINTNRRLNDGAIKTIIHFFNGNRVFTNMSFATNNRINAFQITLQTILQNGQTIHLIPSQTTNN
jgi:hypothetical protein